MNKRNGIAWGLGMLVVMLTALTGGVQAQDYQFETNNGATIITNFGFSTTVTVTVRSAGCGLGVWVPYLYTTNGNAMTFTEYTDSVIRKRTRKRDDVIADLSQVIELNPKDTKAYNLRGCVKYEKGDWDGAIADYSKTIALDPKSAPAYGNRGEAKAYKGDLAGAIADLSKAIELDPKYFYYRDRAKAKKAKGDQAGADADFAQAQKLQELLPPPRPRADLRCGWGQRRD